MSLWWYVDGREVNGPCSLSKLNGLLQGHKLMPHTWVWSRELVRWTRAKDVPILTAAHDLSASDDYTDLSTISLPVPDPDGPQRPGPWTRWIVQGADQQLLNLPAYLLIWLMGHFVALPNLTGTWQGWVAGLTLLPIGLWIQALMIGRFGTTPFKRMAGVRISAMDGTAVTPAAARRRQFGLWWRGDGLGVPIVSMVTGIIAFLQVSAGRRTAWDQAAGLDMRQSSHRPGILLLIFLASGLLCAANIKLLVNTPWGAVPTTMQAGEVWQWRNPVTNKIARIDAGWGMTQESRDNTDPSYWFTSIKGYGSISIERNRTSEPFVQYAAQQLAGMPGGAVVDSQIDPARDMPRCLRASAETDPNRGPLAHIQLRVCATGRDEVWVIKGRSQNGEIDIREQIDALVTRLELTLHRDLGYLD